MKKFSLPVIHGNMVHFPPENVCPCCHKHKVYDPESNVILSAGALLMTNDRASGHGADELGGFLAMAWDSGHDEGPSGPEDIGCMLNIIDDAHGGQGELYFCSTQCLRRFFNICVDALETLIDETKAEEGRPGH